MIQINQDTRIIPTCISNPKIPLNQSQSPKLIQKNRIIYDTVPHDRSTLLGEFTLPTITSFTYYSNLFLFRDNNSPISIIL